MCFVSYHRLVSSDVSNVPRRVTMCCCVYVCYRAQECVSRAAVHLDMIRADYVLSFGAKPRALDDETLTREPEGTGLRGGPGVRHTARSITRSIHTQALVVRFSYLKHVTVVRFSAITARMPWRIPYSICDSIDASRLTPAYFVRAAPSTRILRRELVVTCAAACRQLVCACVCVFIRVCMRESRWFVSDADDRIDWR